MLKYIAIILLVLGLGLALKPVSENPGTALKDTVCPVIDFESEFQTRVIAETIAAEACGEGAYGMLAVADTIANRASLEKKSPYEIVIAPKQYKGYVSETRAKRYDECKETAQTLATNIENLQDVTNGALYFKTKNEKKQRWHKTLTIVIGAHEFYK